MEALYLTSHHAQLHGGDGNCADRGCSYASDDYQTALEARGIACSMSRRGNCCDNAVIRSFFSSVEFELGEWVGSHGAGKMRLFD